MYIGWETIITAGAVVSALAVIIGFLLKWYKRILKQDEQGVRIDELTEHHNEDVSQLKKENYIICYALSACLDGLMQLNCNHSVPEAKQKLDEYLNQQAHE